MKVFDLCLQRLKFGLIAFVKVEFEKKNKEIGRLIVFVKICKYRIYFYIILPFS